VFDWEVGYGVVVVEVGFDLVGVEVVDVCGYWGVCGEDGGGLYGFEGFVECYGFCGYELVDLFEVEEVGVFFVGVVDVGCWCVGEL